MQIRGSIRLLRLWIVIAMIVFTGFRVGYSQSSFLNSKELRTTLEGHTLIGQAWAEFYSSNGEILGRGRFLGTERSYVGKWSIVAGNNGSPDRVCYDYEGTSLDTCSFLRVSGEQVSHFSVDGRPKNDGVARRLEGNQLNKF